MAMVKKVDSRSLCALTEGDLFYLPTDERTVSRFCGVFGSRVAYFRGGKFVIRELSDIHKMSKRK